MKVKTSRGTIVLWLVLLLASGVIVGCGEIKEVYLFTYPIYATASDPKEMQAREIERQKVEYLEYLDYIERCPEQGGREEHTGPVMRVLTARF